MATPYADILRRRSRPLEPIGSGESPVLRRLGGIRAVLFDLYGTLFISASGEVGVARQRATTARAEDEPGEAMADTPSCPLVDALIGMGLKTAANEAEAAGSFFRAIEASHAESHNAGIDFPEVDLVEIWRTVLAELARQGLVEAVAARTVDLKRLAVEYEARANPCWPMPQAGECLERLRRGGLLLGIVSNAQFYTPELFEAFLGGPAEQWGVDSELQYYSYRHGRAKPGLTLFQAAADDLAARGIAPADVLFVGNDMLNDILPARKLGFHTALFAGDARSLRRRNGDGRLMEVAPDLVLTELGQLPACLGLT